MGTAIGGIMKICVYTATRDPILADIIEGVDERDCNFMCEALGYHDGAGKYDLSPWRGETENNICKDDAVIKQVFLHQAELERDDYDVYH